NHTWAACLRELWRACGRRRSSTTASGVNPSKDLRNRMVKRQFPRPKDLYPLLQFKKPTLNAKKRRLDRALTIYDLREIAERRTPRAPFDYTEGAAEAELSLARARQAFEDIEF